MKTLQTALNVYGEAFHGSRDFEGECPKSYCDISTARPYSISDSPCPTEREFVKHWGGPNPELSATDPAPMQLGSVSLQACRIQLTTPDSSSRAQSVISIKSMSLAPTVSLNTPLRWQIARYVFHRSPPSSESRLFQRDTTCTDCREAWMTACPVAS